MPDRYDNYQLLSWPKTKIDRGIWNSVLGDIAARLTAREELEASFEALIEQGTQASLDYVQATIAPQLETLQNEIEEARGQIEEIIGSGTAPNSDKLGGQLPSYYASVTYVDGEIGDLATAVDAALGFKADKSTTFTKVEVNDLLSGRLALAGGKMSGAIDMAGNALSNAGSGVANYVKGLITSKTAAYIISVAAGEIKSNGKLVINAAAFTKNLNAAWAAGSGNGGRLDAAAITASTTYHLQALRKDSDGSFDWGYSLLPIPATVPAGYTWVGRFDWCYINTANTAILDYTQVGSIKYVGDTLWTTLTSNLASAKYAMPAAIPVPAGISTAPNFTVDVGAGSGSVLGFNSGDGFNPTGSSWAFRVVAGGNSSQVTNGSGGKVKTDNSRQVWLAVAGFGTGSISIYVGAVEDYTLNRIN